MYPEPGDARIKPAALLLLLLALAPILPAPTHVVHAHAESADLADQLRRILDQLYNNSIGYEEAARLYNSVASCSQPPVSEAASQAAKALESAAEGRATAQQVEEALLGYAAAVGRHLDALAGCSSATVYQSLLLAFAVPTPAGLLPVTAPTDAMRQAAAEIAYSIVRQLAGSEELASQASLIARVDPYAALLLAGLAGRVDQGYWASVNDNTTSTRGLCLVYSLAATDTVPQEAAAAALAAIAGASYAYGPGAVLAEAASALKSGDLFCYTAIVNLLDSMYRGYVEKLFPLYKLPGNYTPPPELLQAPRIGGIDALRLVAATASREGLEAAALARMGGEVVASPSGVAAVLRASGAPVPETPGENGYCLVFKTVLKSLLEGTVAETQQAWSLAAAAASLCYAQTGSPQPLIALLLFQPFVEMDPWLVAEGAAKQARVAGDPGLQAYASKASSLLWSGRLDEAASLQPPSSPSSALVHSLLVAAVEGVKKGFNPLLVDVDNATAQQLLEAAGLPSPRDAVLAALDPARVMDDIARDNTTHPLERLGIFARAASLRPGSSGYLLDYAAVRAVSWLVVHMYPWLRGGEQLPPPGQQPEPGTLLSWALGYVTTAAPPQKEAPAAGQEPSAGGQTGGQPAATPESTASSTSNETSTTGPGSGAEAAKAAQEAEQLADQLEALAREIKSSLGGQGRAEAVAGLLEQIAQSLREGDYASAVAASQQLLQMLNSGDAVPASLLAMLAQSGVDPREAAQLLAMAASIRFSNTTVAVDLGKASQLAETLSSIDLAQEGQTGLEKIAEIAADIGKAAAEAAGQATAGPQAGGGAGPEGAVELLEIKGLGDLAAKLYSLLGGQPPGEPAGALDAIELTGLGGEGGESNATAGQGPPIPEPPRLPGLPGLPGLGDLAVVAAPLALAGIAMLAATRYRELAAVAAGARLARLERRLSRAPGAAQRPEETRRLVVEVFSQILRVYETVYAPRAASETHREYAAKLPGDERSRYTPAASVYEKAKFSSEPVSESDVEKLQKMLSEIRRALGAAGGSLAAAVAKLLGGRK